MDSRFEKSSLLCWYRRMLAISNDMFRESTSGMYQHSWLLRLWTLPCRSSTDSNPCYILCLFAHVNLTIFYQRFYNIVGYTGNGHQCADINECLVNNGGCSINPMVQCTNTLVCHFLVYKFLVLNYKSKHILYGTLWCSHLQGSKSCGPCPPGYLGNGFACQYVGMCHMNNGGCYPSARCVDNPSDFL